MKEILVVYYTQSGQLFDILENITSPIKEKDVNVSYLNISLENPFPFPWIDDTFYDAFPETFLQIPAGIHSPKEEILNKKYDLILLGYQVWFLSPSPPVNSFLKSIFAEQLLKDTPVVTVVACRNMWIEAQEKVKKLLAMNQANHVGHIALVDRHINHISVITIEYWMTTGRKDRKWGIFPKPGVSDTEISTASKFGNPIIEALLANNFENLQADLLKLNAVKVNPYLVMTDARGNVLFGKWANFLIRKGGPNHSNRLKWIRLFKLYLKFAIWVIAPIVFIVFLLTYFPTTKKRNRERKYYSSVYLK